MSPSPATDPHPTTRTLAERHEALWLELTALRAQVAAIAARRPSANVAETVRIAAESRLAEAAPFARQRGEKLPVAAPDYAGLAVQLGQALARLEAYELMHSAWDQRLGCRIWIFAAGHAPVRRLRPVLAEFHSGPDPEAEELKLKLERRIRAITRDEPEERAEPAAETPATYPRVSAPW
jgi:hypothetical protein